MIDAWSHLALIWVGEVSHKDVAVILDDSSKFGSHPKWHDWSKQLWPNILEPWNCIVSYPNRSQIHQTWGGLVSKMGVFPLFLAFAAGAGGEPSVEFADRQCWSGTETCLGPDGPQGLQVDGAARTRTMITMGFDDECRMWSLPCTIDYNRMLYGDEQNFMI